MPRNYSPVAFYNIAVERQIDTRINPDCPSRGKVASRDLGRYYQLMQSVRDTIGVDTDEAALEAITAAVAARYSAQAKPRDATRRRFVVVQ